MTGFNDEKPKHEEGNWSWSWSCTSASACYDVSNKQTNSTSWRGNRRKCMQLINPGPRLLEVDSQPSVASAPSSS
ncbi:hypothetical protein FOFC_00596 [Fusarium oxysporum]|nr:hypothetical protein FOFC_00596 [Fusarium oxysporum]